MCAAPRRPAALTAHRASRRWTWWAATGRVSATATYRLRWPTSGDVDSTASSASASCGSRNRPSAAPPRPEHLDAFRLTSTPKGISASTLRPALQELLRRVLAVCVGRIPDELAEAEAAKYAGERLHALTFARAGGIVVGEPHYYRLQGPRLLVEHDNTQRDANHVHSVWRDPEGDVGADVLSQHYRAAH
jgi:Protein of unknown function (DUF3500)